MSQDFRKKARVPKITEKSRIINSHAVSMAVEQPLDFEIDFSRNPIARSAA